jgi:CheY-like chemotaxis protein
VWIQVEDNGCGMDSATRAKIFDPFFTTKFTGRGLGLAAVHGILRGHKGAITVESKPGQGSTFTAYFPSGEAPIHTAGTAKGVRAAGRRASVLVVDDEDHVRGYTKAALERLGYDVLLAQNGRQALELLGSHAGVNLVVLDILMPVVGGVEAFAEIRARWPKLRVLVASGYSQQEAERLGMPGDVQFLEKPYTVQTLAVAVEKALKGRGA